MDRTGIIVVTICVILLAFSFYEQQKHFPRPVPAATNMVTAAQTTTTATGAAETPPPSPMLPAFLQDTNLPEQLLVCSNREVRYTFTSRGGGLKLVELLDYPETISARWRTQKGHCPKLANPLEAKRRMGLTMKTESWTPRASDSAVRTFGKRGFRRSQLRINAPTAPRTSWCT